MNDETAHSFQRTRSQPRRSHADGLLELTKSGASTDATSAAEYPDVRTNQNDQYGSTRLLSLSKRGLNIASTSQ